MNTFTISGNYIDLFQRKIYPARITVQNSKIIHIEQLDVFQDQYILPGLVDAHIHIESSMLVPSAFAHLAVVHGSVATVSDPHEIANVCGVEGVRFMIENSKQTPFKFFFGAPSCVPATGFETAGAVLDAKAIEELLSDNDIWYLAEMMNYPGVLFNDPEVMAKLEAARKTGKPIDGHAPGVRSKDIAKYASAGITTDHESFTLEEAFEKISLGIKCLIREGSAAKNFDALIEAIRLHPQMVMFCSDDKHPDELVLHHINNHVKRALAKGYDLYDVLRASSVNPVMHYNLPVGLLRMGDAADFIVVNNLDDFDVLETYINGALVAKEGKSLLPDVAVNAINNFHALPISQESIKIHASENCTSIRVVEAIEGQLVTNELIEKAKIENGLIVSDTEQDILKLVVVNRYMTHAQPAVAFIKNFGLKHGAIASTVAHDCHNIIAVGVDDESIVAAINSLVKSSGGISVATGENNVEVMPLPIAGLMTDADGYHVAEAYSVLDKKAKELGSTLKAPFMTLSFMALLVIPSLKLSDKGLFNGKDFAFTDVQVTA